METCALAHAPTLWVARHIELWLEGCSCLQGLRLHPSSPRTCCCAPRPWQTDVRMPRRQLRQLEDSYFNSAFQRAIEAAVQVSTLGAELSGLANE